MPTFEWPTDEEWFEETDDEIERLVSTLAGKVPTSVFSYIIPLGSNAEYNFGLVVTSQGTIMDQLDYDKTYIIVKGYMPKILSKILVQPSMKMTLGVSLNTSLARALKSDQFEVVTGFIKGQWSVVYRPSRLVSKDVAELKAKIIRRTVQIWKKSEVKDGFQITGNWTGTKLPMKSKL